MARRSALAVRPREWLADAIDRKDNSDVLKVVESLGLTGRPADAIVAVPDLYGDAGIIEAARRLAPNRAASGALDRLEGVVAEFEDPSELMLDLAMARRLSYYTGVTFRAYTFDFGQPLLGGGRYDGALLPSAAGFSVGLERLLMAVNGSADRSQAASPLVVSVDDAGARRLRSAGYRVVRAVGADASAAEQEARDHGATYLLVAGELRLLAASGEANDVACSAGTAGADAGGGDVVTGRLRAVLEGRDDQ